MKKIIIGVLFLLPIFGYSQTIDTLLGLKGKLKYDTIISLPRAPLMYLNAYGNFGSLLDSIPSGSSDFSIIRADNLGTTPTTTYPFSTKKGLYLINYSPSGSGSSQQSSPAIYFRGSYTPSSTSVPIWGRVYLNGDLSASGGMFEFQVSTDSLNWTTVGSLSNSAGFSATRGTFSNSVSASVSLTVTNTMYASINNGGINLGGSAVNTNPFAFVNMTTTNKGVLVNRMSTTARMQLGTMPWAGTITSGSGYTFTTGSTFSLTGGSGTGATARIFQTGGAVNSVTLTSNSGLNYKVGDVLSATLTGGSGFTYTVTKLQGDTACGLMVYDTTLNKLYTWNCSNHAWEPQGQNTHVVFTPTTGGTITTVAYNEEIINPAGTLAALTIALPSSPNNNDKVYLKFTQAVTTITYSGGTVVGLPTSATAGQEWYATYDLTDNKWY